MSLRNQFRKLTFELNTTLRLFKPIKINKTFMPIELSSSSDLFGKNLIFNKELNQCEPKENQKFTFFTKQSRFSKAFQYYQTPFNNAVLPISPFPISKKIIEPNYIKKIEIEKPVCNIFDKSLELPCNVEETKIDPVKNIVKKEAVKMLIIRRKKMKKHKWKKLQKRMKFEFAKIRQKRKLKKEMVLQSHLKEILKEGINFSAEDYIKDKLDRLNWIPPVTKVRGRLAPQWVINEHLQKEEHNRILQERIKECLEKSSFLAKLK